MGKKFLLATLIFFFSVFVYAKEKIGFGELTCGKLSCDEFAQYLKAQGTSKLVKILAEELPHLEIRLDHTIRYFAVAKVEEGANEISVHLLLYDVEQQEIVLRGTFSCQINKFTFDKCLAAFEECLLHASEKIKSKFPNPNKLQFSMRKFKKALPMIILASVALCFLWFKVKSRKAKIQLRLELDAWEKIIAKSKQVEIECGILQQKWQGNARLMQFKQSLNLLTRKIESVPRSKRQQRRDDLAKFLSDLQMEIAALAELPIPAGRSECENKINGLAQKITRMEWQ